MVFWRSCHLAMILRRFPRVPSCFLGIFYIGAALPHILMIIQKNVALDTLEVEILVPVECTPCEIQAVYAAPRRSNRMQEVCHCLMTIANLFLILILSQYRTLYYRLFIMSFFSVLCSTKSRFLHAVFFWNWKGTEERGS